MIFLRRIILLERNILLIFIFSNFSRIIVCFSGNQPFMQRLFQLLDTRVKLLLSFFFVLCFFRLIRSGFFGIDLLLIGKFQIQQKKTIRGNHRRQQLHFLCRRAVSKFRIVAQIHVWSIEFRHFFRAEKSDQILSYFRILIINLRLCLRFLCFERCEKRLFRLFIFA